MATHFHMKKGNEVRIVSAVDFGKFRSAGFEVISEHAYRAAVSNRPATDAEEIEPAGDASKPLEEHTLKELRDLLKAEGGTPGAKSKDDLIDAILEQRQEATE